MRAAYDRNGCVFICGSGHSGSTLLEMLLAGHSEIVAVGELQNLSHQIAIGRVCSCGVLPRDCPRWQAINARVRQRCGVDIFEQPFRFPVSRERPQGTWQTVLRYWNRTCYYAHFGWRPLGPLRLFRLAAGGGRLRFNTALLLEAARDLSGAPIVVDSSKDYVRMREIYDWSDPGTVRIIYLTRDGRGCAWSAVKRRRECIEVIAREWAKNQKRTWRMLGGVPAQHQMRVCYESLCSAPAKVLEGLCAWLDLKYEPAMLQLAPAEHHTIAGNQIRVQRRMTIRLDDEWRHGLDTKQMAIFDRLAGDVNRKLGYAG